MAKNRGTRLVASRKATEIVADLALRQHGVIRYLQAKEAGLSHGMIAGRVANGRLVPVFRGVYKVTPIPLERRGRWMAATLAAGRSAVLSFHSAAALHGLIEPRSAAIQVTRKGGGVSEMNSLPSRGCRSFTAMAHRSRSLSTDDLTIVDSIPVTTVSRTLLDMAAVESRSCLISALSEAERLGLFSRSELVEATERGRGWAGVGRLREAIQEWDPLETETRSELEVALLRICRAAGISPPVVNSKVGDFIVDFFWPKARLVVEVDGFEFHRGKRSFRGDRNRDVELQLAGFRVARFTHQDVVDDGPKTVARIRKLLEVA